MNPGCRQSFRLTLVRHPSNFRECTSSYHEQLSIAGYAVDRIDYPFHLRALGRWKTRIEQITMKKFSYDLAKASRMLRQHGDWRISQIMETFGRSVAS